jgi:hypothetical protein
LLLPQFSDLLLQFEFLGGPLLHGIERDFLVRLPADRAPYRLGVIGVYPGVVPGARNRPIKLLAVDELGAAHRIDVDN